MAVWSIPNLGEIEAHSRWDSEFYQPHFRSLGQWLATKCKQKISDVAKLSLARFDPSTVPQFEYLEISEVDLEIGAAHTTTVSSTESPDRAQFLLSGNEILVSTVRPNRSCVALLDNEARGWVASSGFAVLEPLAPRLRSFLFVWLKMQAVTDWLDRCTTASMYPAVSVPDIMTTPTPKLGERIIDKLHQLIGEMEANMVKSRYAYPAAEAELLDRIGWDQLREKPEELSYVRRFADLASSARFDSEFFRPSPNRVRAWLAKNGAKTIGELCHFVEHGIQPTYIEGGTVGIVSQRQFRTAGLDLDLIENFTNESFLLENPKFRILKSDVLTYCVSAGEYLGRTFLFNSDIPCVAASFVTILRTKDVIPGYMALFLNSPAGLIQSNMFKRGTSPFYLYPRDLKQVLIPLPRQKNGEVDIAWQKRLAAKVEAATAAKVAARAKLEEAKHLVEDALTS